ncbi:hypothetical protein [Pelagicoccus mobilis]|uniref:Lipoprotein n=1 Tax=Pelagicoccus mobilis TaxID=415221 RepID=A0A934VRI8_9BACT|nr:hypothetical protein [Pelagicoccus mobilis]MBK1879442.1 hypothetical protein [Pelagicoccus mobilis]
MRSLLPKSAALMVLTATVFLAGCETVPAYRQEHVSKAGMTFSDSLTGSNEASLTAQLEPGSQTSGGAQASGCSACR